MCIYIVKDVSSYFFDAFSLRYMMENNNLLFLGLKKLSAQRRRSE